ncbi:hypothetical protein Dsin_008828 [Dipteronia sinensis]|uniref:Reverse transcriptase domain-containing protein n=1 Tax=Dipteronia sinensis TaxID=43782 RepID=A0AAE0APG0_9ROSI|nr:hypothetical protein Dsin_008828 [Dipteronia sinensis]
MDGLPAIFYQKYWEVVGTSVTMACLSCLNGGESLEPVNRTLITLIPKTQKAECMADYRPISLCNVTYKIVAKTLANKLRGVMCEVISDNQSAFIPGRLISDSTIIGFECLHALKRRKRKNGSMALKLDMSKAYDHMEWSFFISMMEKMGFSDRWVNRIRDCISSVSFAFNLNGDVCGSVKPSRGLRQGDPLSPYLFPICAEGLSCILRQAVINNRMAGFQCIRAGPNISHLFFADDCLLFSKASEKDCRTIKYVLDAYAKVSGQIINFKKSSLCVSKSIMDLKGRNLADIVGVRLVDCHAHYLGLPCFTGRKKKHLFEGIKDRIWNKIKGWNAKIFSSGGKEVLVRVFLQAIPTYGMSLFRLPKSIIRDLHRMFARFRCGGAEEARKIHWGSWEKLCESKNLGGLGFRNLDIFSRALLSKQGWRLISTPNSLVARVLKNRYYPAASFLKAEKCSSRSMVWNSILWGWGILEAGTRCWIGNGSTVYIKNDRWIPQPATFQIVSPRVFGNLTTLNTLFLPSGGWNVPLIKAFFLSRMTWKKS